MSLHPHSADISMIVVGIKTVTPVTMQNLTPDGGDGDLDIFLNKEFSKRNGLKCCIWGIMSWTVNGADPLLNSLRPDFWIYKSRTWTGIRSFSGG